METNPQPEEPDLLARFQMMTVGLSDPKERKQLLHEGAKLYKQLLAGKIPLLPPKIPREKTIPGTKYKVPDIYSHLIIREIPIWFRMFAFIHMEFVNPLALAMNEEFGEDAQYLEVIAGKGWLAKGLAQAGLPGKYIATDLAPAETVFPVIKMDAVSAVKKYRDKIDAYIISWPPMSDFVTKTLEQIPVGGKIIYLGEPGGCCGTREFFARTEVVDFDSEVTSKYWRIAEDNYFAWAGINDRLQLRLKIA